VPVDVVVVEQAASATPIETRVALDGVDTHGQSFSLSHPISLFSSFLPLSASVVTVIMKLQSKTYTYLI